MDYKSQYVEAIKHVNDAVLNSDPYYWFPKIISVETEDNREYGRASFKYDLGNGEQGSGSGHSGNDHGHAYMAAMLRLIRFKEPCTLFAFPIEGALSVNGVWKQNVQREDIVVGFITDLDDSYFITPAWNERCIYPMIGNWHVKWFDIPKTAKWMLCATLDTQYRKAVSLYCQAASIEEQKLCTPQLNIVVTRKKSM